MKNDGFEKGLLEYGSLMKQSYAYIVGNCSKIIAIIVAIVAALLTFTEISVANFSGAEFTSTLMVLLICSYVIYFSLEDAGERLGESSSEFLAAAESYKSARSAITPSMIPSLRAYCIDYSAAELRFRRDSFLCSRGYSSEEYDDYLAGRVFPKASVKVFKKAKKLKAVNLSPTSLLSPERVAKHSELENPERRKRLLMLLKLIPSTLCMLLTASVILTVKENMSASVIIDGVIKLSTLPIIGFRGYESGYSYAKGAGAMWVETKARLINDFLSAYNKSASKEHTG